MASPTRPHHTPKHSPRQAPQGNTHIISNSREALLKPAHLTQHPIVVAGIPSHRHLSHSECSHNIQEPSFGQGTGK